MRTVLSKLLDNLFHPFLVNSANDCRMHTAQSLISHMETPGYSLYLDWESSTDQHIRIRAEHNETGISLKLHVYPPMGFRKTCKVSCEGPRWFKKYPLAHMVANGMMSSVKWKMKIRSK